MARGAAGGGLGSKKEEREACWLHGGRNLQDRGEREEEEEREEKKKSGRGEGSERERDPPGFW